MIELPIGTRVKTEGRHGIVEKASSGCDECLLFYISNDKICNSFQCLGEEREDRLEVIVREIVENESKSVSS